MRRISVILLLGIVTAGLILRLSGLFHGLGAHPDERHMVMVTLDKVHPSMSLAPEFPFVKLQGFNPESFAYGSFPYYLTRLTAEFFGVFFRDFVHYDNLFYVGRTICILLGTAAIVLVFWLVRFITADRGPALVAAALLAFNVLHIQLSRYFTVDVMLTTMALGGICAFVKLYETGRNRWAILSGIIIGVSVGTKISGMALLVPWGLTLLLMAFQDNRRFITVCRHGSVGLCVAILTFIIVEPYALISFPEFYRQVKEQTDMAQGKWRPPYTIQYENTLPFFYPVKQMLLYTMGIPVALVAFAGFLFSVPRVGFAFASAYATRFRAISPRTVAETLCLVWIVAVFLSTAGLMVKYPRYLLPVYPELFALAGIFLWDITARLDGWRESPLAVRKAS